MTTPALDAPQASAAAMVSIIASRIRDHNVAFWKKHKGFTRSQLHGHRVGAAYIAFKAYVSTHRPQNTLNFQERVCQYANLLRKEMEVYESTRRAKDMKAEGSYRRLKSRITPVFMSEARGKAEAYAKVIADGPSDFEVDEESWPADLALGSLLWWRLIEPSIELSLDNVLSFDNENSDMPLAELEVLTREETSQALPGTPSLLSHPHQSSTRSTHLHNAPALPALPAPPARPHGRGKAGRQPDAERVALPEPDIATGSEHKTPKITPRVTKAVASPDAENDGDGEDNANSDVDTEGDRAPSARFRSENDEDDHDVPDDIAELFHKLRTSKKAYMWRAPGGIVPKIPANGLKTADDIRAAHTDASGKITSLASLSEVTETDGWHGLKRGGAKWAVPCNPCADHNLDCHATARRSCTNCYANRGKCHGGQPPQERADIRPERRFYLLKQLEDVMGGWDERLNDVGESLSEVGAPPPQVEEGPRRRGRPRKDKGNVPNAKPKGGVNAEVPKGKAGISNDMDVDQKKTASTSAKNKRSSVPAHSRVSLPPSSRAGTPTTPHIPPTGTDTFVESGQVGAAAEDAELFLPYPGPENVDLPVFAPPPSRHPPRGPRRVPEMESEDSVQTRKPLDRPRVVSLPLPSNRSGPDVDAPFTRFPGQQPRITWEDIAARVEALEHHYHSSIAGLQTGMTTMNGTVLAIQASSNSASNNARQSAEWCSRIGLLLELSGGVNFAGRSAQSSDVPRFDASAAKRSATASPPQPGSNYKELIREAVESSTATFKDLFLGHLKQTDKNAKELSDQFRSDAAARNAQMEAMKSDLEALEKRMDEKFEAKLAALSISSPTGPTTIERLDDYAPRHRTSPATAPSYEAGISGTSERALKGQDARAQSAGASPILPSSDLNQSRVRSDEPCANVVEFSNVSGATPPSPHPVPVDSAGDEALVRMDVDADEHTGPSRKRRNSAVDDGVAPLEEQPHKRRRSRSVSTTRSCPGA